MREIKKSSMAKLLFTPVEEWETLDSDRQQQVAGALESRIRWLIYDELGKGTISQAELSQRLSKFLDEPITSALLRHHLKHLEKAGLVKSETKFGKKVVYRAVDVRIQVKTREGINWDKIQRDFEEDLKRVLKGEPLT